MNFMNLFDSIKVDPDQAQTGILELRDRSSKTGDFEVSQRMNEDLQIYMLRSLYDSAMNLDIVKQIPPHPTLGDWPVDVTVRAMCLALVYAMKSATEAYTHAGGVAGVGVGEDGELSINYFGYDQPDRNDAPARMSYNLTGMIQAMVAGEDHDEIPRIFNEYARRFADIIERDELDENQLNSFCTMFYSFQLCRMFTVGPLLALPNGTEHMVLDAMPVVAALFNEDNQDEED